MFQLYVTQLGIKQTEWHAIRFINKNPVNCRNVSRHKGAIISNSHQLMYVHIFKNTYIRYIHTYNIIYKYLHPPFPDSCPQKFRLFTPCILHVPVAFGVPCLAQEMGYQKTPSRATLVLKDASSVRVCRVSRKVLQPGTMPPQPCLN